jgi:hypothetical protein
MPKSVKKNAARLSPCHNQISQQIGLTIAAFCGN